MGFVQAFGFIAKNIALQQDKDLENNMVIRRQQQRIELVSRIAQRLGLNLFDLELSQTPRNLIEDTINLFG